MLRRMGPLQGLLKMIPGMSSQLGGVDVDETQMGRVEAIVRSMTPRERSTPHVIDGKRRQRIARGSGTTVQQVNQLLESRKLMERMMKQMGQGKLPGIPGAQAGAPSATRNPGSKRKKNKRKAGRR
jgi:signal recognition particle subunit SRP54